MHIVRYMLATLAKETRGVPNEYIQQQQQRLQQRQQQGEEASSSESQVTSEAQLPARVQSKVNEGMLVEVLCACARWPDAAEAKQVALQVHSWVNSYFM